MTKTLPKTELLQISYLDQIQAELREAPLCRDLLKSVIRTFGDDWPLATHTNPSKARAWLESRIELVKLLRKAVA